MGYIIRCVLYHCKLTVHIRDSTLDSQHASDDWYNIGSTWYSRELLALEKAQRKVPQLLLKKGVLVPSNLSISFSRMSSLFITGCSRYCELNPPFSQWDGEATSHGNKTRKLEPPKQERPSGGHEVEPVNCRLEYQEGHGLETERKTGWSLPICGSRPGSAGSLQGLLFTTVPGISRHYAVKNFLVNF